MRNLKKLLSVVLVVAMIAGLCAVGSFSAAAAEYSETTNYKEAAAVVTGVGVMDGYEDGTMQYDKTVTREEAAAIICRALIGVDTAKKLSTAVAPFADVAANRWSAPYINYLKSQGIVNGKTATQFDPTAEVTAVEFAKMMLCAVGYGKAGEFVGASWDVNTITAANNNGVYTGTLAADLTAPATREQCMLYAFNTMTRVPVVNYNTAFQSYYVGTSVVSGIPTRVDDLDIGNSGASKVPGAGVNDNGYPYTLAYRNFKLESQIVGNDDFGRDAVKWVSNGKAITEEVCSKTADYTLYGRVTSAELYNTLGKAVVKDINATHANFEAYTNGVGASTSKPVYPISDDIKSGENMLNAISGAGDTVELYVYEIGGTYFVKAVIIQQMFAKVTKVDTAANKLYATVIQGDAAKNVTNEFTNCVADGDDVNISGLKKDDYILVNVHNNGKALANGSVITSIATPKTAVGTYKGTTFMGLARDIDGNTSFTSGVMSLKLDWTVGNQYTYYYDSLGNVIYSEFYDAGEAAGTTAYFYVTKAEANNGSSILSTADATLALNVVYTNGGAEVVKVLVNKDNIGKYVTITNGKNIDKYYFYKGTSTALEGEIYKGATTGTSSDIGDFIGKFFSYTKTADGYVKLSLPNSDYAKAEDGTTVKYNVNANKASVKTPSATYSATTSTVFTVIDENGTVLTFTGYNNFPVDDYANFAGKGLVTYAKDSTKLKTICFFSGTPLTSGKKLALCGGFWSSNSDGNIVIFYVDGEYKMVTLPAIPGVEINLFNSNTYYPTNAVCELTLSDNGNDVDFATVVPYSGGTVTEGYVNTAYYGAPTYNGSGFATATSLKNNATTRLGLGHKSSGTGKYDEYYAWAVIDDVDGNVFRTKADKNPDATVYPGIANITSSNYYFDGKTNIYDCRDNKCVKLTELPTGVAFVAYVNEKSTVGTSYRDLEYCEYIWIVG